MLTFIISSTYQADEVFFIVVDTHAPLEMAQKKMMA